MKKNLMDDTILAKLQSIFLIQKPKERKIPFFILSMNHFPLL